MFIIIVRIRNATERQIYGRMRQNAGRGRYLALSFLVLGGVFALAFCRTGASTYAQIVTPLPGPMATATAAAVNKVNAQAQQNQGAQMQNAANDYRAKADRLESQGTDAINSGKAAYDAASQDAQKATDAINAQQFGVASELLTRAQSNIDAGQGQLNIARESISELKTMIYTQTETIDKLTSDLEQERTAHQTILSNYNSIKKQLDEAQSHFTIDPAIAIIAGGFLLLMLIIFVAWKWSQHRDDPPEAQPIDAGYEINQDEVIDQDQERTP